MSARPLSFRTVPESRGVAWDAADVAREIFNGKVSARWVREHFTAGRDRLGWRTVIWWSKLALAWKESHSIEGAA